MIDQQQRQREKNLLLKNLLRLRKSQPEFVSESATAFLEFFASDVKRFLHEPQNSGVSLGWIRWLLTLYSELEPFELAEHFYSKIDLRQLAHIYQHQEFSNFSNFLIWTTRYLRRLEPSPRRTNLVSSIFADIDLAHYAKSINKNLEDRLDRATLDEFTSQSSVTLASTISSVSNNIYTLSNLVDDDPTRKFIRSRITELLTRIEFRILGKLIKLQKKDLGVVIRITDILKKAHSGNAPLIRFLSELDFRRLALSYNNNPIGNTSLANFCKRFLSTKQLFSEWKIFFETLDFSIPFKFARFSKHDYTDFIQRFPHTRKILSPVLTVDENGVRIDLSKTSADQRRLLKTETVHLILIHSGFSTADATFLFQIFGNLFFQDYEKRNEILEVFNFWQIGLRAKGGSIKGVDQLLRRFNQLRLSKYKYRQFIDGFGSDECKRLLKQGSEHIVSTVMNCRFDEQETQERSLIEIMKVIDKGGSPQFRKDDDWESRIRQLQYLVNKDPNNFDNLVKLAQLLARKSKDHIQAEKLFRKAINIRPESYRTRFKWIQSLIETNNLRLALAESRRLIDVNYKSAEHHNLLANILKKLKKWEEAEEEYRQALKYARNNKERAKYLNNIALLILDRSDEARFGEAIDLCEMAISSAPQFEWPQSTKSILIQKKEQFGQKKSC